VRALMHSTIAFAVDVGRDATGSRGVAEESGGHICGEFSRARSPFGDSRIKIPGRGVTSAKMCSARLVPFGCVAYKKRESPRERENAAMKGREM
jgi:hypothetical protein